MMKDKVFRIRSVFNSLVYCFDIIIVFCIPIKRSAIIQFGVYSGARNAKYTRIIIRVVIYFIHNIFSY